MKIWVNDVTTMKKSLSVYFILAVLMSLSAPSSARSQNSSAKSDIAIPHLLKHGTATQLIVNGKPFLALGANSAIRVLPILNT